LRQLLFDLNHSTSTFISRYHSSTQAVSKLFTDVEADDEAVSAAVVEDVGLVTVDGASVVEDTTASSHAVCGALASTVDASSVPAFASAPLSDSPLQDGLEIFRIFC